MIPNQRPEHQHSEHHRPPREEETPRLSSLLTSKHLPFQLETLLLIVLSIGDVILTFRLIGGGRHVEANPVAAWVINTWGWQGMVIYKFVLIAFICTLAQVIALYRKSSGMLVMWIAVLAHALVVMYSLFQLIGR